MIGGMIISGPLKIKNMDLPKVNKNQKRVVIVGAGFAGLNLAKKLPSKLFQVVLLDRNNYHQFQPLLYQVATSGLEPSSICFPLRKIFHGRTNIFIRIAEVELISPEDKCIRTNMGDIEYDYLVLAYGAITNYFNNSTLEENAFPMKSVSEALLLRNTLLQNYEQALTAETEEERDALLNVVVVGGGPTGVELAGAIAEMKQKILPKDYAELNFKNMHIYLLEASPNLLNGMNAASGSAVRSYLQKLGVEVKTGAAVKDYDGVKTILANGEIIYSSCLIWAAGVKGSVIKGLPSSAIAPNDRILVDQYNYVKGESNIFAIGDIALMESKQFPKGHPQVAQVAIQQAEILAKNLKNLSLNGPLLKFQYKEKGRLATVGRNLAVAELGRLNLKGFFAWFIWMLVHLMSIIGIKNRMFILLNWIWQYFTYDPSLRLIIKPKEKTRGKSVLRKVAALVISICSIFCI